MMLCAKFGWNWPSGSGEEVENVKNLRIDRPEIRGELKIHQESETITCMTHTNFKWHGSVYIVGYAIMRTPILWHVPRQVP